MLFRFIGTCVLSVIFSIVAPIAAHGAVVISEILFNPEGEDTGKEWVRLFNDSHESADISGWQFYPDGAGYLTLPQGTSIGANASLTVRLRTSGDSDHSNFHHSSATGNMGNSSGSAALFSSGERGSDTIKSFVRYHKPGSTERKTWESSAVSAGIWQAGSFVDIMSLSEGDSIALRGEKTSASGWIILPPSLPVSQSGETGEAFTDEAAGSFPIAPAIPEIPRLAVEISADKEAIVGADHRFLGRAYGSNKTLVDSTKLRYLWNFGDGSVAEGPGVTHTFRFPGTYTVYLSVNSGSAVGSVVMAVTAGNNQIRLSEYLTGEGGFVEIENRGSAPVAISGWRITNEAGSSFTFPEGTLLRGKSAGVFPNAVLGIASAKSLLLLFGNGVPADEMRIIPGSVSQSTSRNGDILATETPTPGIISPPKKKLPTSPSSRGEMIDLPRVEFVSPTVVVGEPEEPLLTAQLASAPPVQKSPVFPAAGFAVILSVLLGIGFVFLRRGLL